MPLPTPREIIQHSGYRDIPAVRGVFGADASLAPPQLNLVAASLRECWIEIRLDKDLGSTGVGRQAYRLAIPPKGPLVITAGAVSGARYALQTLAQLVREHGNRIPCMVIDDRPVFETRGVMLDVSRDRVPTMEQFEHIVNLLAELKLNHLQLYTEHTFAYVGHEVVWEGWSPLTPSQVRHLDSCCAARGIELAANQNCFGHMVPWLKHAKYAHLAETLGDWMFDIWPRSGPFSLCPTDPASLDLVKDLLAQLLPCFQSSLVNIGCDETYDIAFGRSRQEVERRGRAAVYMEFVHRIADVCRVHGKRAQFWGDIALSHPECVKDIPQDAIVLAWGYEPESPFDRWGQLLGGGETHREFWVCPGTSTWRTITGRTTERQGNLKAAAIAGRSHNAPGYLVCDWGDSGHHQQWPLTVRAIAQAAHYAWNPDAPADGDQASLHVFGDRSGDTVRWLDAMGDADLPLRERCGALSHPTLTRLRNQTAIFIDMFKQLNEQVEVGTARAWSDCADRIRSLESSIPVPGDPLLARELAHTARYALFAAERGMARRLGRRDMLDAMPARVTELAKEHEALWRLRSREGGLSHSLSYFDQVRSTFNAASGRPGEILFE